MVPDAHLLIVDDDERIRGLLQKFLMRGGFLVSVARDAAQARRILAGLEFDLIVMDVMMPVMARNLLESIRLLSSTTRLLADRVVDGIVADEERCRELAESSPSVVTPLNKYIGYENAAVVAKTSLKQRKTIRQVVLEGGYVERGDLTEAQLDAALDVLSMTRPPVAQGPEV